MDTVRFGFIGAGMIAESAFNELSTHQHAQVLAIQDLNEARREAFKNKYGLAKAYRTAEELFSDSEVDAVYIAVPNKFHAPLSIAALEAGKHVMLEKPFALNLVEAEAVARAVEESGKQFLLGMNQRYRADSQQIASLAQQGAFGEVYHAKAFWYRRSGIPKLGTWFGNKALAGGGALYDIGVHLLDLCLFAMDNFEPVAVTGQKYTKFGNRGLGEGGWGNSDREDVVFDVDDFSSAFIRMKHGATLTLDVSWAIHQEAGDRMNVELFGTEGGATLYPAKLFRRDSQSGQYSTIEDLAVPVELAHQSRFHNFTNLVLGTEKPLVTLHQALAVQRILDAIEASANTGREIIL